MTVILDEKEYLATFNNRKLGLLSLSKYRYLFPLKSSSRLSGIAADLTGDGYLGRGLIQYISKSRKEALRFRNEMNLLFRIKGKIRRGPTSKDTWECLIGGNAIVKILRFSGVPFGNKTNQEFDVSKWIYQGSREYKARYVQRLFDCEGTVFLQEKRRIRIKIQMYKSLNHQDGLVRYLNQIREILECFGIKTTNLTYAGFNKRKDGSLSRGMEFEISGTRHNLSSVVNFQRYISFETKRKAKILRESIRYLNAPVAQPG
jgi:hypothetical protein